MPVISSKKYFDTCFKAHIVSHRGPVPVVLCDFFEVVILKITIRFFKFVCEILPTTSRQPTIQPQALHTATKNARRNIYATQKKIDVTADSIGFLKAYRVTSRKLDPEISFRTHFWWKWVTKTIPDLLANVQYLGTGLIKGLKIRCRTSAVLLFGTCSYYYIIHVTC